MKKTITLIFIGLIFSLYNAFSKDRNDTWKTKYKVVNTEWFEIIYPEESEYSAAILVENADSIYQEIGDFFGQPPKEKMPVLLDPDTEVYNANFSPCPYNRIVIYDTADIFYNNSNSLLNTFRHELTHAYTFNLRNDFWKGAGTIFGDVINPGELFIHTGWAESATMTSESSQGEGRLNDEYSNQTVRQAKVENYFPDAADVTDGNKAYLFYGAFAKWLQDKYGMEKYTDFWFKCVNFKTISEGMAFKKTYGISIKNAWKMFEKDIDLPDDIIYPHKHHSFHELYKGKYFSSLKNSQENFYYIDDFRIKSASIHNPSKTKTILTDVRIEQFDISSDSRLIAIDEYDLNRSKTKRVVSVYDIKHHSFHKVSGTGLRNAAIIQTRDGYYLIGERFVSQNKNLQIYKIIFKNDRISEFRKTYDNELPENHSYTSFIQIKNEEFVCIKLHGLIFSIEKRDITGKITGEFNLPYERMSIRNLSYNDEENNIYFSWTKPGQMPSFGRLNLETGTFDLAEDNISGGVYYPVKIGDKLFYSGKFYKNDRIIYIEESDSLLKNLPYERNENLNLHGIKLHGTVDEILKNARNFPKIAFFKKGLFIPASIYQPADVNATNETPLLNLYLLGATYAVMDPLFKDIVITTSGYSFNNNSFGSQIIWNHQEGDIFSISTIIQGEADSKGWKQAAFQTSISSTITLRSSAFSFNFSSNAACGRENLTEPNYVLVNASGSAGWGNIKRTGFSPFEKFGISAVIRTHYIYNQSETGELHINKFLVSPQFSLAIPKLLPVNCTDHITCSLPVNLAVSMYSSTKSFISLQASVLLFDLELFKGLPFYLYVNRLYFTGDYNCSFGTAPESQNWFTMLDTEKNFQFLTEGKSLFTDSVSFLANLDMRLNMGAGNMVGFKIRGGCDIFFHTNGIYSPTVNPAFQFSITPIL